MSVYLLSRIPENYQVQELFANSYLILELDIKLNCVFLVKE